MPGTGASEPGRSQGELRGWRQEAGAVSHMSHVEVRQGGAGPGLSTRGWILGSQKTAWRRGNSRCWGPRKEASSCRGNLRSWAGPGLRGAVTMQVGKAQGVP